VAFLTSVPTAIVMMLRERDAGEQRPLRVEAVRMGSR
jgi:hypothetical protein